MNLRKFVAMAAVVVTSAIVHAAPLAPLQARCTISIADDGQRFRLEVRSEDCAQSRHCGSNFSN